MSRLEFGVQTPVVKRAEKRPLHVINRNLIAGTPVYSGDPDLGICQNGIIPKGAGIQVVIQPSELKRRSYYIASKVVIIDAFSGVRLSNNQLGLGGFSVGVGSDLYFHRMYLHDYQEEPEDIQPELFLTKS